jgi:Tol biopolymer transport system component
LTGDNPDGGGELFLFDIITQTFTQITSDPRGPGFGVREPQISADGTRIAFVANMDLTGGNPDGNAEIFLASCGAPEPEVTVAATDPSVTEVAQVTGDRGIFTITRGGDTTNALTANFTLAGTATQGTDYNNVGTSVTIPADQSGATVTILALADTLAEGTRTVILSLATGQATPSAAQIRPW